MGAHKVFRLCFTDQLSSTWLDTLMAPNRKTKPVRHGGTYAHCLFIENLKADIKVAVSHARCSP
jgi:hypothetical protein